MIDFSAAGAELATAVEDHPPSVDDLRQAVRRRRRRRKALAATVACLLVAAVAASVAATRSNGQPATQVTSQPPTQENEGQTVPADQVSVAQIIDTTHLVGTFDSAVVMSDDGGRTWVEAGTPTRLKSQGGFQVGFADTEHGWAWSTPTGGSGPNVEVTEDGGRTWTLVPALTNVIDIVAGPDGSDVWALTNASPGPQAATSVFGLWTSADKGATWQHTTSGAGRAAGASRGGDGIGALSGLVRAGATTGYQLTTTATGDAVGQVSLTETTNSGATWTTRSTPCTTGALLAADKPGDLWLLCLGPFGTGAQHVTLYRTTADGQPWKETASSKDPFQSGQAPLGSIPALGYPTIMVATTTNNAYLLNVSGELTETTDGGSTWQPAASTFIGAQYALTMVSPTSGAAWLNDALWITSDGVHWYQNPKLPATTPTTVPPTSPTTYEAQPAVTAFVGPLQGYAVRTTYSDSPSGTANPPVGEILQTVNGGNTWTVDSNQPATVFDAITTIDNQVIAVGAKMDSEGDITTPVLVTSSNSGTTWTPSTPKTPSVPGAPFQTDPFAGLRLKFFTPQVGLATRAASLQAVATPLETTDGGATWTPLNTPGAPGGLTSVTAATPTTWIGTGQGTGSGTACQGGELYVSENAGTTWTPVPSSCEPYSLEDVTFPTATTGYAVGGTYIDAAPAASPALAVIATTDGGKTWTQRWTSAARDGQPLSSEPPWDPRRLCTLEVRMEHGIQRSALAASLQR